MYRISFDTNTSRWIISLQCFGFLWMPIRDGGDIQSWPDYNAAVAYVEQVGLSRVYRNYADSATAAIWQGMQPPNNQPTWQVDHPAVIRNQRTA